MSWDNSKFKKYKPQETGFGNAEKWRKSFQERFNLLNNKQEHKADNVFASCKNLDEVKKKYRELAKQFHPDIIGNTPENCEIFAKIAKDFENIKKDMV